MNASSAFTDALCAAGPVAGSVPGRADRLQLYGQFLGSWEMDATVRALDGTERHARGEIHFARVLEGRAIQDVWILPARGKGRPELPDGAIFYGTTLRIYDPGMDAWHILWSDPVKQYYTRQIGRLQGGEIVQEGSDSTGIGTRWRFTEITPASFLWLGERKTDASDWFLQAEFRARRTGA